MQHQPSGSGPEHSRGNLLGAAAAAVAALLGLTGCGSGNPGETTSASSATPSTGAGARSSEVLTDQELMAISSMVLQEHGGSVDDTAQWRKSYALLPSPPSGSPRAEPNECNVFHTPWQHEAQLDRSVSFALGNVPVIGTGGDGMVLFDVRSAPREALVRADFDYSQDLMARCATFEQARASPRGSEKYTIRLLAGPNIGEKAYVTKSTWNGITAAVGLRVLAGAVSVDLGLNQGPITEEEGLKLLSQIAQQVIEKAKKRTQ